MTTFSTHISRDLALRYGQEAVQIIENGEYRPASGKSVQLTSSIALAVSGTVAYPPDAPFARQQSGAYSTQIEVQNETTLSAVQRLRAEGYQPVALNFASATHPGGGFLNGARAQEEYLARSSALYACLRGQPMYAFHRRQQDSLYTSYTLYSPNVPIFRDDNGELLETPYPVGIITAAAPNAGDMPMTRQAEIEQAFRERIAKVLWIGLQHGHDAIVLGAWGCGAFGNDGRMVSHLFRQALMHDFRGVYRKAIFAIVDWSEDKLFIGPFENAFGQPL